MTKAQRDCLRAVIDAGSAVMQSHGRVLAAGEWLPFAPVTFLRLIGNGYLQFSEPKRLVPTAAALKAMEA